ncbi:hypothetical protein EDC01DRAFT_751467 [Geopyxis carbonaria]|nr:hypothetical protein EDC01DRAFT_751467 [Geopyxis carbonaria]
MTKFSTSVKSATTTLLSKLLRRPPPPPPRFTFPVVVVEKLAQLLADLSHKDQAWLVQQLADDLVPEVMVRMLEITTAHAAERRDLLDEVLARMEREAGERVYTRIEIERAEMRGEYKAAERMRRTRPEFDDAVKVELVWEAGEDADGEGGGEAHISSARIKSRYRGNVTQAPACSADMGEEHQPIEGNAHAKETLAVTDAAHPQSADLPSPADDIKETKQDAVSVQENMACDNPEAEIGGKPKAERRGEPIPQLVNSASHHRPIKKTAIARRNANNIKDPNHSVGKTKPMSDMGEEDRNGLTRERNGQRNHYGKHRYGVLEAAEDEDEGHQHPFEKPVIAHQNANTMKSPNNRVAKAARAGHTGEKPNPKIYIQRDGPQHRFKYMYGALAEDDDEGHQNPFDKTAIASPSFNTIKGLNHSVEKADPAGDMGGENKNDTAIRCNGQQYRYGTYRDGAREHEHEAAEDEHEHEHEHEETSAVAGVSEDTGGGKRE